MVAAPSLLLYYVTFRSIRRNMMFYIYKNMKQNATNDMIGANDVILVRLHSFSLLGNTQVMKVFFYIYKLKIS